MKTRISFEVDDEDEHEIKTYLQARDWRDAVMDLDQSVLRPVTKHGDDDDPRVPHYEEIREKLWQILREYDLSF